MKEKEREREGGGKLLLVRCMRTKELRYMHKLKRKKERKKERKRERNGSSG